MSSVSRASGQGLDDAALSGIVDAVAKKVRDRMGVNRSVVTLHAPAQSSAVVQPSSGRSNASPSSPASAVHGVHDDLDKAVSAARAAFEQYEAMPLSTRYEVVRTMRQAALAHVDEMSRRAFEETGLGRYEDKRRKNHVAITKTPGPEFLEPVAQSGDDGLMLMERAPYGVICSITPCTNPTETIINNGIGMVAGGNAVLFNVHPLAKKTSAWYISLLNDAIVAGGGPKSLLNCLAEPTIESAQKAMRHPGVRIVVVTGGGAVVQEAMRSGKRAISAGPGNPPVVVDETAHLEIAAAGIISGASFDNNIICTCEKEIIATAEVADELSRELERQGAYKLAAHEVRRLESELFDKEGHLNRSFVGKNAGDLLALAGKQMGPELRMLFAEVEEAHPFVQHEMLMPVLGFVRAPDVESAIQMAKRVEHGYGHTAVMYSTHIEHLSRMARVINTSIFVKNAPNYAGIGAGGEGYTSWTIASPTGEGLTTCRTFTRERRCTLKDHFRIV